MEQRIIDLEAWFETPAGTYVRDWEQAQFDRVLVDMFGYHALQLGQPGLQALQANRMPHRWMAAGAVVAGKNHQVVMDFAALPFPESSLDLVVLPHALDMHPDPHAVLREVARVLLPGGRVAVAGFNPASLWGLRWERERLLRPLKWGQPVLPECLDFLGTRRLRDWLRLLDFEVETGAYGCYRPLVKAQSWLRRWRWMDQAGAKWWPFFGSVYVLVAVKRVHGVRLYSNAWRRTPGKVIVTAPATQRQSGMMRDSTPELDNIT